MGLLGNSWDDPQSQAVMALAGGLLQGNFGRGATGYADVLAGAKDKELKRKYLEAQLLEATSKADANRSEVAQAARKQAMIERMFGAGATGGNSPSPAGGVNREAAMLDYLFNGGKKIGEWTHDSTKKDMTVSGGFAFDKNAIGPGYLPQLNIARDGQASMVQIGPDGLPVVSAPTGALDTFAKYRNVDEGTKANFDPVTVTPQGQNPQMTTRGALVRNPAVQGAKTPMSSDRELILSSELAKAQNALKAAISAGDQSGAARAQGDIAALKRELGGNSASVGMPLQSEAENKQAGLGVEADAKENIARSKDVKTAEKSLSIIAQAEKVFETGPTASGLGSLVDSTAAFFGKATDGAIAAQQLKALGGWLVANVPRMEGPQSNFDVANYQIMAADVANESLPIERRKAALQTIKSMMQKTVDTAGRPTADAVAQKTFADYGYKNEADVIRDAQNTIMRNPGAKTEVMKRLKDMGVSLPSGYQGAW